MYVCFSLGIGCLHHLEGLRGGDWRHVCVVNGEGAKAIDFIGDVVGQTAVYKTKATRFVQGVA